MVNRKDGVIISFRVNNDISSQFKSKLELDNITQKDLLETAILSYLYGDYSLEKNGRKITCFIDVE